MTQRANPAHRSAGPVKAMMGLAILLLALLLARLFQLQVVEGERHRAELNERGPAAGRQTPSPAGKEIDP